MTRFVVDDGHRGAGGLRDRRQRLLYPGEWTERDFFAGLTTESFPTGLSKAPVLREYLREKIPMEFLGGFVGVRQDPAAWCLRPEIGWAVREAAR